MSDTTVTLGGVTFTTVHPEGVYPRWRFMELDGWFSGAPVETKLINRPIGDGAFRPARSLRRPKLMSLNGIVEAASHASAVQDCYDQIANLSPDGQDIELAYTDDAGTRTMIVRVSGTPQVSPFVDRKARFAIPLVAYDPRKLGPARVESIGIFAASGGGMAFPLFGGAGGKLAFPGMTPLALLTVTNLGKAPGYPEFSVSGGFTAGFEIVDTVTNSKVVYNSVIFDGVPVTYSTRTRRARSGGVSDVTDYLSRVDDLSLDPGETRLLILRPLGGSSGTPTLTKTMKDAWY